MIAGRTCGQATDMCKELKSDSRNPKVETEICWKDIQFGGSRQVAACGMEFHILKSSSEIFFCSFVFPAFLIIVEDCKAAMWWCWNCVALLLNQQRLRAFPTRYSFKYRGMTLNKTNLLRRADFHAACCLNL
jgi:hypothetical protein